MSTTDVVTPDQLEQFGLSKYESRVYLCLLTGDKTAKEIVENSDIPTGRIYDVLGSLESRGLTEKQDSRPKKYIAIDPTIALQKLLAKQEAKLNLLKREADNIETKLAQLRKQRPEEGIFWSVATFADNQAILRHNEKINEAKSELLLHLDFSSTTPIALNQNTPQFLQNIREIAQSGVDVKIIIGGITKDSLLSLFSDFSHFIPLLHPIEIRVSEIKTYTFDVIDSEKTLVKIMNPVKPDEYFALIYVWQKRFAVELRDKFLSLWENAVSLSVQMV
ncbi:MAG: TrmB family transcriptional regulator [Candidatus Thorarchaeota archaeon]